MSYNKIFIGLHIDLLLLICNRHNLQSRGSVGCSLLRSEQSGHNDAGRAGRDARQEINTSGNKMQTQQLLQRNRFVLCVCVCGWVRMWFCVWSATQQSCWEGRSEANYFSKQGHCSNTFVCQERKSSFFFFFSDEPWNRGLIMGQWAPGRRRVKTSTNHKSCGHQRALSLQFAMSLLGICWNNSCF